MKINDCVRLHRAGAVGILEMDNPPVNALGHELRHGLWEGLRVAAEDPAIGALVIIGRGRNFSAGADIAEFGKRREPPLLSDVIARIEASPDPTIAAIRGACLGGGFELALGCDYRLAVSNAAIGLPEVRLGLLPGAGGTQRLPRLIGPQRALDVILSGERIPAASLLADGALDRLVEGDLEAEAVEFARKVALQQSRPLPVRDRQERLSEAQTDPAGFEAYAAAATQRLKGQVAPDACVAAVRDSFRLSFEKGLRRESERFAELVAGEQSRALRHLFFAERRATRVADMPRDVQAQPARQVAVIGAGTMGTGIAICFANVGVPVVLVDVDGAALERGRARVAATYQGWVGRGRLERPHMDERMALIQTTTDRAMVGEADLVIEAVFEDMALKQEVFQDLGRLTTPETVLATNTSALDVDAIAATSGRPETVVGMHFFAPAHVMKVLEVVRGRATSWRTLAAAVETGRAIGKIPVTVGVSDGFVGNRMNARRAAQVDRLLLEGCRPQDIDAVAVEFGFPMGPLAVNDMSGLDIGYSIRRRRGTSFPAADAVCEAGRLGQKSGAGYYRYEDERRMPLPDPQIEEIIRRAAERARVPRREIASNEILERMLFPIINEGARILEEGVASRPGDIDVIWVHGFGWPPWRGGPMYHADMCGLPHICERLAAYAEMADDETLEPAPLLAQLARKRMGFAAMG